MADTSVEDAINNRVPVVADTSILLDYLKALLASKPSEEEKLLINSIRPLGELLITPHVFAEISNLGYKGDPNFFGRSKNFLYSLKETYIPKDDILQHPAFVKFGACDAGIIIHSLRGKYYLLTKDGAAQQYAKSQGAKILYMGELTAHYLQYGGKGSE